MECPKCGCEDRKQVDAVFNAFNQRFHVYECGNENCRHLDVDFTKPIDDGGTVAVVKRCCPHCGSGNTVTERTKQSDSVIRYHRCRVCLLTFKSIEIDPSVSRSTY